MSRTSLSRISLLGTNPDPDEVEIGDDVVAIGHPETAGLWTLTTGVISSVVKDFQGVNGKDVFQTEASINRGNSGGPLLNDEGQMVAINTCISRRAADGLAITDINFSLKSSVPVEWMKRKDLMTLAYVKRGLDGQPVAQAEPEKPAAPAIAAKPSKPEKKPITVKSDDGTIVAVVEPEKGEEVAEDPEFGAGEQTEQVSNTRALPQGQKAAPVKQEPEKKPEAKILTKARPYKMDPFVQARLKEIKALEDIMDESRQKIRQKSGKKSGGKGLGLW
jgi:serine protease Do